ncbi:MAG: NAD(P)/FAD-dependent oxidoreductase [Sphaerospermopsis kisseleviana]
MANLLAESRLFTPRAEAAPIRGCDATATIVIQASGGPSQPVFRAGEAAFTLDPISSSGVECALRGGSQAAAAAHTVLSGGELALAEAFLWERMVETVAGHARWARHHYMSAAMSGPFWEKRSCLTAPEPETPRLEALKTSIEWQSPDDPAVPVCGMASQVRLAPDLRVERGPCLEGDLVIARPVVIHPSLERPVAFVGNHDLPSLLAEVRPGSLQALVDQWSTRIHRPEAARLAGWSLRKGLLELC